MRLLLGLLLRAAALAMGVATLVFAMMRDITIGRAIIMLSLGLIFLSVSSLEQFTRGVKLVPRDEDDQE